MLKKILIGTLACGLVGGFLFGRDAYSYVGTACDSVREVVQNEIPPEFQLKRIRGKIDRLMPEIKKHMKVVAVQSVDVKDLERDIAKLETSLATQKREIIALRDDLDTGKDSFTYRHVSFSRDEMKSDVADRFAAFKTGEDALLRQQEILEAQKQILKANKKKLDAMLARKQQLAVSVSRLEARLKTIQATEAVHQIEVDDSALSEVEAMIDEFNHDLDVRESMMETEGAVNGRIPVDLGKAPVSDDVLAEIDMHFQLKTEIAEASGSSL